MVAFFICFETDLRESKGYSTRLPYSNMYHFFGTNHSMDKQDSQKVGSLV